MGVLHLSLWLRILCQWGLHLGTHMLQHQWRMKRLVFTLLIIVLALMKIIGITGPVTSCGLERRYKWSELLIGLADSLFS